VRCEAPPAVTLSTSYGLVRESLMKST